MITDDYFVCVSKSSSSAADAARKLNMHPRTYKARAEKLKCYFPNKGGRGLSKKRKSIDLNDILAGLCPQYQSFKLKKRLYDANIKTNECEICGVGSWNGKPLECELDHIDGDSTNHVLSNLRILCPNCHSQTPTFRFKRGKNNGSVVERHTQEA